MRAEMRHHAESASALAGTWCGRWRDEAVAFFAYLPVWSVERTA
ncbi:hypothetical protein [Streptomyces sp. JB150]|nr:hypothetical protein [Streptomyces sp. JB150]